jgi:class 3 adenylate cyclase
VHHLLRTGTGGGTELEIGVLFADVRGFTSLAEDAAPEEVAARLAPFYKAARSVLIRNDAVIDKLVGDEVMALFIPTLIGEAAIDKMVSAGVELLENVGAALPVGAGADFGPAYVGNVGEEDVKDFTALGDVVNTAPRLQAQAEAGQLVVLKRVFDAVRDRFPSSKRSQAEGKGRARSRRRDRRQNMISPRRSPRSEATSRRACQRMPVSTVRTVTKPATRLRSSSRPSARTRRLVGCSA